MNGFTSFPSSRCALRPTSARCLPWRAFSTLSISSSTTLPARAAPIGWASTTALLLLLGGMILVVLGIMGEYVGRIYMCANAAPQYVEREVIRHEENDA